MAGGDFRCCILVVILASVARFHHTAYASLIPTSKTGETIQRQHYARSAYLDHGNTVLFNWRIAILQVSEERSMSFLEAEISAPTLGYIGWGISPNGGMTGADILLMWVDDVTGKAHLQDRYADGFTEPHLDEDQTSILDFDGEQNATHTTFRFRRDLEAGCNDPKQDLNIPLATAHIIFALGKHDVGSDGHALYHGGGAANRGSKTLFVRDDSSGDHERDRAAALAETTDVIEIRSADIVVPVVDAFYECSMTALPNITEEFHVVAFEPLTDVNSSKLVHHFVLYLCDRGFVPASREFGCYNADTAVRGLDIRWFPGMDDCIGNMMWAWSIGGNPLYMPKGVGLSFNPQDSGRYILIEVHYDTSTLKTPRSSGRTGVRLRVAKKLRPSNAKHVIIAGLPAPAGPLVPGRAPSFQVVAPCGASCTNKFLPASGVTLFSVFLHGHIFTRAMVLRHFRGGEELPLIASDIKYDNHFQAWRPTNVTILPGDSLMLECNYTTTMRNKTVFPGWRTSDEMCMAFSYVTPPTSMEFCTSIPSVELSLNAFYPAKGQRLKPEPVPAWVAQYHKSNHRRLNSTRTKRDSQTEQAVDPRIQFVRSMMVRNESKMFEIDAMDQIHFDRQLVTKYISGGAVVLQKMFSLQEKFQQVDWDLQRDDIERLQRVYLEEPITNACYGASDYFYEARVPYADLKTVSRPLQANELSDGC